MALSATGAGIGNAGTVPPPPPTNRNAAAEAAIPDRSSPSRQYATAYDALIQADWLKTQGMMEESVMLYKEAQSLFLKLSADYPSWETNVVAFRLKYCADALARFRPVAPPAEVTAPPPLRATAPEPAPAPTTSPSPADNSRIMEYLNTGLQKERSGNLKRALEAYLTVLRDQPWNREALKGAARCYLRANMLEDARAALTLSMELPKPDSEQNMLMAMVYCQDREFYKAYQLLLIALNEQPSNAGAHLAMGVALAGLNKLEEARVETQKAIQIDPKLADAYYNLARLSLKLKPSNPGVARDYYLNALRYGAAPDPALNAQLR